MPGPTRNDETAACTIIVHGRVQGVFYRASTEAEARRLGLAGTVRNEADGSVRIEAEGQRPAIEALIAWCRHGPPGARVDGCVVDWHAPTGRHEGFSIRL